MIGLYVRPIKMIGLYVILAMPLNMIFVMYVVPCILSYYDFNKLTILYIHVHISLSFL